MKNGKFPGSWLRRKARVLKAYYKRSDADFGESMGISRHNVNRKINWTY